MKNSIATFCFFILYFLNVSAPVFANEENPNPETKYCFLRAESFCSLYGKKVVYSLVKEYLPTMRDELLFSFQEQLSSYYVEHFEITLDVVSHLYSTKEDAEYARELCIVNALKAGSQVTLAPEEKLAKH